MAKPSLKGRWKDCASHHRADRVQLRTRMDSSTGTSTPAQQLVGKELPNGWKVEELIEQPETATWGCFSTSYIVRSGNGERAFLKAMDYRKALESSDPARALQTMTAAYNFERDILEKCNSNRLSRIVRVLDSGSLPPQNGDASSVVEYLILEVSKRRYSVICSFFWTGFRYGLGFTDNASDSGGIAAASLRANSTSRCKTIQCSDF